MISKYISTLNSIRGIIRRTLNVKSILYVNLLDKTYQSYSFTHKGKIYGMTIIIGGDIPYIEMEIFSVLATENFMICSKDDYEINDNMDLIKFIDDAIILIEFTPNEEEYTFSDMVMKSLL